MLQRCAQPILQLTKKTVITFLIVIPLTFYAGLKCEESLSELDKIGKPSIDIIKFQNRQLQDTVYLVRKTWGYTGDHEVFALTTTKPDPDHWWPDSLNDYVWRGDNTIYYQRKNDTLQIWTSYLPDKKTNLGTKQFIQINLIDGETSDNLRLKVDTSFRVLD